MCYIAHHCEIAMKSRCSFKLDFKSIVTKIISSIMRIFDIFYFLNGSLFIILIK